MLFKANIILNYAHLEKNVFHRKLYRPSLREDKALLSIFMKLLELCTVIKTS